MRNVLAVLFVISSQILCAQLPSAPHQVSSADSDLQRRLQQEAFEKWALDQNVPRKDLSGKEAEAVQEFYSKARHFVDLWEVFAAQLNDKKVFNAKLAKQVSKAFHDMEKSDGWPIGRSR